MSPIGKYEPILRIAELGSHAELIALHGIYYCLNETAGTLG